MVLCSHPKLCSCLHTPVWLIRDTQRLKISYVLGHNEVSPLLWALTFGHVLRDDVDRLLRHHSVKLHQFLMPELLHDLSLLEKSFRGHGSWFQSLYGHACCAIPSSCSITRQDPLKYYKTTFREFI